MDTEKKIVVPHRRHFLETLADIGSGYVIAVVMQILIFPLFGIETSYFNMFIIGAIFMSVSMVRSWLWRRFFHIRYYRLHVVYYKGMYATRGLRCPCIRAL